MPGAASSRRRSASLAVTMRRARSPLSRAEYERQLEGFDARIEQAEFELRRRANDRRKVELDAELAALETE